LSDDEVERRVLSKARMAPFADHDDIGGISRDPEPGCSLCRPCRCGWRRGPRAGL
jgi:hypothetical protein